MDIVQGFLKLGMIDNAYAASFELVYACEKLALLTRELPCHTGHPKARAGVDKMLLEVIPIRIGYTPEGWFSVVLPALLPKKEKGSTEYIRRVLRLAMQEFFSKKVPVRLPKCTIIYRHVYDRARPERQYRDHDNMEVNMVTDVVAYYTMIDDSAMRCSHYYCSAPGMENRTEVYIVPDGEMEEWLIKEESYPDSGIELLEKRP